MQNYLCITIRFLDGCFHGRSDGGEPEWPPSPLRLFQALVAAAAARWNEREKLHFPVPALSWLESLPPPVIIAPDSVAGALFKAYVPNNAGDLVARSWARGGEADWSGHLAEKEIQPIHIRDADEGVHYLWPVTVTKENEPFITTLLIAARSITHLGWGIDMVVADASIISQDTCASLRGNRWEPKQNSSGTALRIPNKGTLENLIQRHGAFLKRTSLQESLFQPVPALSVFGIAEYRRSTDPVGMHCLGFMLRHPESDKFRMFDVTRQGMAVAGMMKHAMSTKRVCNALGWSEKTVAQMILGHAEKPGDKHKPVDGIRFAFIPVPSMEPRGKEGLSVGGIHRLLVVPNTPVDNEQLLRIGQILDGNPLIDQVTGRPVAVLSWQRHVSRDRVFARYLSSSRTWATVSPLILPGYDDPRKLRQRLTKDKIGQLRKEEKCQLLEKLDNRVDLLIRKAIQQSVYGADLARYAALEWRNNGFWTGSEPAIHYSIPEKHRNYRRLHIRITWRDASHNPISVPGPICLGRGRYYGLGLFAPEPEQESREK